MAEEMYGFVKIDGVEGEAQEAQHQGWSEVYWFDFKLFLPQKTGGTTGRVTGDVQFEQFAVTKRLEKSSPDLFMACCKGTVFSDVTFERLIKTGGGNATMAFSVKLQNAIIAAFEPEGETEKVTFSFTRVEYSRVAFGPDGRTTGTVTRYWDLTKNEGG